MMMQAEAAPIEPGDREPPSDHAPVDAGTAAIAKAIVDLDELLGVMRRSVPPAKTWQRTLLAQLADANREIEILRLTISMERGDQEITSAAIVLQKTLALARVQLSRSRADGAAKVAARLADTLARQIRAACESGLKVEPD